MKTLFTSFLFILAALNGPLLRAQGSGATSAATTTQSIDALNIATDYVNSHLKQWGLTNSDVADMMVSDQYTDKTSGITRIYFQQAYKGIPIHNAILNVCMAKEGNVYFTTSRFIGDLAKKITAVQPTLSPQDAVIQLSAHLGFTTADFTSKQSLRESQYIFENTNIAREDIVAELCYQPLEGKVVLSWDVSLSPKVNLDSWSARVDALSGEVIRKDNGTLYCLPNDLEEFPEDDDCTQHIDNARSTVGQGSLNTNFKDVPGVGAQYNVWPAPFEDPLHGPQMLVINPADSLASPFGWHDINGVPGAEYTKTIGNNTWTYQDTTDSGDTSNDEPDGGTELQFDFPYDPSWEPRQYTDAATVNLFYWINYLHDFSYHYGFDEAAGNFQKNNYGRGGLGNDFIWSVSQYGSTTDTIHNNGIYVHKNEGQSPSIFLLDFITQTKYLIINEPAGLEGKYVSRLAAPGWGDGSYITTTPVTGEVVLVNDGVEAPSTADACQEILNSAELAGKIALIDRGTCQFGFKALQAQNAGAIGVIFCNTDNKYFRMAAGPDAAEVHIPVVSINVDDAQEIRHYVEQGLRVTLVNTDPAGPERVDGDLQNSIIGHEFGHGISLRLAGGPNKECLDNAEQMGEGWSDYFGLVTTVMPGDSGAMKRVFGAYAVRDNKTGKGLRRYAYSTDMSLSPLTYGDVATSQERHDLGEVWANVLWDMYWAMVDRYGWSEDPYDELSGNYRAVRLVVDGLKNMACDPGFVDGRDAILAADEALYNGENSCLLWEVFARRGLGYSADQGSPYDAGDQVEAFDLPPACTNSILIQKSVTDFIQPGDDIHVTLKVGNYKNVTVTNTVVTDQIPDGTSFIANSSNYTALQQGQTLQFDLGNLNPGEVDTITYTLHTPTSAWSKRLFLDDIPEVQDSIWTAYTIGGAAANIWSVTDSISAHSGNYSWTTHEVADKSQQALILNPDVFTFHVDAQRPVLRFYHRYQTLAGINGGVVEVKELGETNWHQIGEDMLRFGYKRCVDYRTFFSPDVKAFSGNSGNDFKATYVDLSPWSGQDIQVRFRFGTFTNSNSGMGWCIDDIEFMDLLAYNEEVCVSTDQGDFACAIAPEGGTIVESREDPISGTQPIPNLSSCLYPNPASDMITLMVSSELQQQVTVSLVTLDGRTLMIKSLDVMDHNFLNINVADIPTGLYLVKMNSSEGQYVNKLIIQR